MEACTFPFSNVFTNTQVHRNPRGKKTCSTTPKTLITQYAYMIRSTFHLSIAHGCQTHCINKQIDFKIT